MTGLAAHLEVRGVCKSFAGFAALDHVSFAVERGTIHALLGENGAGKTTVMNVLYGLYRPDSGTIILDGAPLALRSPRDAIGRRIGMIHQHFHLAEALTVTENIVLGLGRAGSRLDLKGHARRIQVLADRLGFSIEPEAATWRLPMGMRQRVEILKALYRGAELLILDEPTTVLAPGEIDGLLDCLKALCAEGRTVLFVTHKLDEVMQVTDAVTVMRHGRVVAERRTAETEPRELSRLMVGRDLEVKTAQRQTAAGDVVLDCRDLVARDDRGLVALDRLSLQVRAGEVLGLTGIDGNGQRELAEAITGLRPLQSGTIVVGGRDIGALSITARRRDCGIGFVPEDRHGTGLVLDFSIADNLVLRGHDEPPAARGLLRDRNAIAGHARALIQAYDIRARGPGQAVRNLSGGNQQKIVLAREIAARPRLLVIMQATKGLDLGAIDIVQREILAQRDKGVAILYISTELEHAMAVADRIGVMHRGRLAGLLDPAAATAERLGLLMAGLEAA